MKKSKGRNSGLERYGVFDVKTVLDWAETSSSEDTDRNMKDFEGLNVLSGLLGYKVFAYKGVQCKCCPTKGEYFALERTPGKGSSKYNNWHFNLYGKDSFGREVMLTKDHVTPRSKGGTDDLENLQPMCMICNTKKGSMHMKEFEAKIEGREFSWGEEHFNHFNKRLSERYSMTMDPKDYHEFVEEVSVNSEIVHTVSSSKSYRMIRYRETDLYVVYSSQHRAIYTALDPNEIEERMLDVPSWGAGNEAKCLEVYNQIMETITSQFKELETQKETAEYLKTCKFPTLMFAHWKKKKFRLNVLVWSVVKSLLKLNENESTRKEKSNDGVRTQL